MLGEIYWNDLPAKVTRIGKKDNEIFILFEGKINGYGRVQSGRIVLKMTTEFQVVHGVVEYHDEHGDFDLNYLRRIIYKMYDEGEINRSGEKKNMVYFIGK